MSSDEGAEKVDSLQPSATVERLAQAFAEIIGESGASGFGGGGAVAAWQDG